MIALERTINTYINNQVHTLQLVATKVKSADTINNVLHVAFETTILFILVPILLRKPLVLSAVKADYFLYLIICQVKLHHQNHHHQKHYHL